VLKPVTSERLQRTTARLRQRLAGRAALPAEDALATLFKGVQALSAPADVPTERIKILRAGVGNTVRMIPIAEVICFEATDKYVTVVTATAEALLRMSLRELSVRLDPADFLQVHRSVMLNASHILSATRDELATTP
jgi:DNA-binding LytR/AlgR family response regulator